METIVLTATKRNIHRFVTKHQQLLVPSKSPYIQHLMKGKDITISIYTSGKIVFQGMEAENYARQLGYQNNTFYEKTKQNMSLIGSDEVGNGSYFGGVAVVATFLKPNMHDFLIKSGVNDSKILTDNKILELTPVLEKEIPHQSLLLSPKKYNEAISNGYNAVSIKVALHNQAIYLLLQQGIQPKKIVIDAFTNSYNYHKYLTNEKNRFHQPICLEPKAEKKYLAVAVSSIIARKLFLDNLSELSQKMGLSLPSGAGKKSDDVAAKILEKYGLAGLEVSAKRHFKNTRKAQTLLEKDNKMNES